VRVAQILFNEVRTKHPVDDALLERLSSGVVLHDDPQPVRAAAVTRVGEHRLVLALTAGRYHQVKRMVAAAGNRVEALHRSALGPWTLPPELAPGHWIWLTTALPVLCRGGTPDNPAPGGSPT
jgi:16S rRNA pseudouridine516 synthase